ncbi:MAG TPA: 4-alpha-glucanotransferase [Trueperaceae bacterium]
MDIERSAGILLHPTSLPGPHGVGALGDQAFRWVDFLEAAGQRLWQVLPLGPTGYGDSPYQSFSAFAGNPYLIDLDRLREEGLLADEDLAEAPEFPDARVDFGAVIPFKLAALERAFVRFQEAAEPSLRDEFTEFVREQGYWLDDFALFMALKESHGGRSWNEWEEGVRRRDRASLSHARKQLGEAVRRHEVWQFLFYRQWLEVKRYANERGIAIIGDIPIFVSFDSADTWANPQLFHLDEEGNATVIAGVPPDYFSATGQRWGNPLYRWQRMAQHGFRWWIDRFRSSLEFFDLIRVDHFRGFEAYWEIPASEATAVKGRWVRGPGQALFDALADALGDLPIIAEDLGVITPEVERLRDENELPGMKVLQFAFAGDASDPYLPHNFSRRSAVYTGTHDNDTTLGWYLSAPESERDMVRRYLAHGDEGIVWELIRLATASVADIAVVPLQDVMSLGGEARMNTPGKASGNWGWRFRPEQLEPWMAPQLREMATLYGRLGAGEAADTPYRQSVTESRVEEGS